MRDLIIGMGDDTDQFRHGAFLRSIARLNIDAEVQIFTHDPLPWHPVVDRWKLIADYIQKGDYRYVIACDTFDVVFQSNPFEWLEKHLGEHDLVVVGEERDFKDCEGNKRGMLQSFPQAYERIKDWEILNAGVVAGHAKAVMEISQKIYDLCQQDVRLPSFTPKFEDRLPDQQALNLLAEEFLVYPARGTDTWAFQYNHKHSFRDGRCYNENGELYAILHQYLWQHKDEVQRVYS